MFVGVPLLRRLIPCGLQFYSQHLKRSVHQGVGVGGFCGLLVGCPLLSACVRTAAEAGKIGVEREELCDCVCVCVCVEAYEYLMVHVFI